MAITDYNKKKKLDVDSVSGTPTVSKAQPIILSGFRTNFEEGNLLNGGSINTSLSVSGAQSLEVSGGDLTSADYTLENAKTLSSNDTFRTFIRSDSNNGSNNDVRYIIRNLTNSNVDAFAITGDGNFLNVSTQFGNAQLGTWYEFVITYDGSGNVTLQVLDLNGNEIASQTETANVSSVEKIEGEVLDTSSNDTNTTGYFDDFQYEIAPEDYDSTGNVIIDFTNISDAQDIAVYDQNGNLLDYEIEDLNTAAETGVLWCYNSWVRDGTTQAQVAYGSNSANTDRQNVTATWGNTGQNAVMVQHLEESSSPFLDSTSNNLDSVSVTGTTQVDGQFATGRNGDGTDDQIIFDPPSSNYGALTAIAWAQFDTLGTNTTSFEHRVIGADDNVNGNRVFQLSAFGDNNDQRYLWFNSSGNPVSFSSNTTYNTGTWYQVAFTHSGSVATGYIDAGTEGSNSSTSLDSLAPRHEALASQTDGRYMDGTVDAFRMYSDAKSGAWIQADYDASSKAGQVFFSQQAAETTTTAVSATVSDSLAFAEITNTQLIINQLVSDQLNLTENIGSTISFTASDSLAIKENNQTTLSETLSESLGFNEATTSQLQDKLTDQLNLSENTVGVLIDTLTDQITFAENINAQLALTVTVTDSLTFGEQTDGKLFDTITEQLGLTENVNSTLINAYADQLNLTENVRAAIAQILSDQLQFTEQTSTSLAATLADSLDFSENLESQLIDTLTDSLGFTEATAAAIAANLTDQLQFTENLKSFITLQLADQLDFSEETIGAFSETFTDQLTFSDQVLFATLLEIDAPTKAIITNVNKFAVMENHVFKEGDQADEVSATLEDENGAIDLSNANSVDIVMQDRAGSTVLDTTATIQNAANGEVTYSWSSGDPIDTAGIYRLEWRINDGSGKQETVPNDGYITIEIEEDLG